VVQPGHTALSVVAIGIKPKAIFPDPLYLTAIFTQGFQGRVGNPTAWPQQQSGKVSTGNLVLSVFLENSDRIGILFYDAAIEVKKADAISNFGEGTLGNHDFVGERLGEKVFKFKKSTVHLGQIKLL